mgnify:CR=1 FL=1
MNDLFLNLAISTLLTAIKESVKNPEKKITLKRAFLKVRNAINTLYLDDPDFA